MIKHVDIQRGGEIFDKPKAKTPPVLSKLAVIKHQAADLLYSHLETGQRAKDSRHVIAVCF